MKVVSLMMGGLFAIVFWSTTVTADTISCIRTEQVGCFEISLLAVNKNPRVPEMHELLASVSDTEQPKVSAVLGGDIALQIYRATKEGRVRYHNQCFKGRIRFFGANESVPISRMAEYKMPEGTVGAETSPRPQNLTSGFTRYRNTIMYKGQEVQGLQYDFEMCGGKWAFQVPWEFLPKDVMVQITARESTVFPRTLKGKRAGLWLTAEQVNFYRRGGWGFVLVPIIFPEERKPQ